MAKGTKYSQEFKEDAVRYRLEQHFANVQKILALVNLH